MKSKNLKTLDKKYIWHPFTQMRDWENEDPLIIEKAKGNWLIDTEGNEYLDGISSLWVTVHGHRKMEIDWAVKKQIDKVAHSTLLGLSNVPATLLAQQLIRIAPPNLKKVFYSDSGSTAVEVALKMAFQYWKQRRSQIADRESSNQHQTTNNDLRSTTYASKTKFLTFTNAYHGDTIGSVSVGGMDLFHQIFKPLLFQTIQANFENAVELIRQHKNELAAVVIEPVIQGAAGMLTQPEGFLAKLRAACDENNVLLIFDEVATGFGRTGKMFACEHEKVWPDILCMAKGITGGYLPLAATLTTQKIYDAFSGRYEELKTFFHGHTYTGNPLACAAALANLEIFRKEKTIQKIQPRIRQLKNGLEKFRSLKHVAAIRQWGLMVGIELMKDVATKVPYDLVDKIGIRVIQIARQQGVILRPLGPVIVLMPPLSITEKEINFLLDVTFESILAATEN